MSLLPYSNYVKTSVEWLPEIPAHWLVTKAKHVCQFSTGWTPPTGDASAYDGQNLWANISDLGERTIFRTAKRISDEAIRVAAIPISPKGSLLFSFKLSIGQVSFAGADMYTNEAIATFVSTASLSVQYAFYAFPLFLVKNAAENIYGAKLLNQELIGSAALALPPLGEQHAIVSFLDHETATIDALIAEQEKLLALLAEKRQATISRAVTRGLDPNVPLKDSGNVWIGKVPQHWKVSPLKYVSRIGNGSTPNRDNPGYWAEEGYPWLNSSVANLDEVTCAEQFVTQLALDECHLPMIEPPAVLVGITGQGKTRGMATRLAFKATVNQHLAYVKPDERTLTVPFLLRAFEMAYERMRTESEGAGSTKGAITCEQLGRLTIPLPDTAEQESIANFLSTETRKLDMLKHEAERAIELLKERRAALITAAVTGKIDVRNAVPDALAA